MSGLTSALTQALSGLVVTQSQTAVVSRNITRASDEDYTRKIIGISTDLAGNARSANISRVVESRLLESVGVSNSAMSGQRVISDALQTMSETIGDVDADGSIAWGIGQLQVALTDYEATPGSSTAGNIAVAAAGRLAQSLNDASSIVSGVRKDADSGIAASVTNANKLLADIEDLNTKIVGGGNDSGTVAELMDKRDAAIKQLSAEMGVRAVQRPNNGIAIYTDGGVTLFDVNARAITFNQSGTLPAGGAGNAVYVDGVQVTGAGAPMPLKQGRIASQVEVRDSLTVSYQSQLDEVARGLINQFAEKDQGLPAVLPDATGLFGYTGSPAVPAAGTLYPGLASEIKISPLYDSTAGGSASLLRDGGANGVDYVYNSAGVSGFQGRLSDLIEGLDSNLNFDPSAGLDSTVNLKSYASSSAGWIEQKRSEASRRLETVEASYQRTTEALAKKSGVNIDEEMATLLNLEKSYQASAKVLSTVDQMLATMMEIVR